MRTVGTIRRLRGSVLTAAVVTAVGLALPAAQAQVRQIQMGNGMDANTNVGSGGSNRPVQGYVPINGNEVMTGNVSGLSYFHGAQQQIAPGVYRSSIGTFSSASSNANLGSSDFSNFNRQSAGGYESAGGLNQIYYNPSSMVSTGQGTVYSAPIGGGYESAIVPRDAISPIATNAQISSLQPNTYAAPSAGLNRQAIAPLVAGEQGAVLSSPLFILRTTEAPPPLGLVVPGGPATMPGTDNGNGSTTAPATNPAMVQGNLPSARITGQSLDVTNAMVSDNYLKLSTELASLMGPQTGMDQTTPDKPVFPVPGKVVIGKDIDPLTGQERTIATLQKPRQPTATGPATKPGDQVTATQPGVSAHSLATLPENLLTAGSKVAPVRLAQGKNDPGAISSYDMTMGKAEQALKTGKYLDAAETYQAALGLKPEDPLALVGRAHSEFGAGLYSSAAHDLKFVFIRKPEMVSVHYDVASFIPAARQEYLMEDLQKLTDKKDAADTASFLYCYLCYQTGRSAAMQMELKKWGERQNHDEWQIVLSKAWTQKAATTEPAAAGDK